MILDGRPDSGSTGDLVPAEPDSSPLEPTAATVLHHSTPPRPRGASQWSPGVPALVLLIDRTRLCCGVAEAGYLRRHLCSLASQHPSCSPPGASRIAVPFLPVSPPLTHAATSQGRVPVSLGCCWPLRCEHSLTYGRFHSTLQHRYPTHGRRTPLSLGTATRGEPAAIHRGHTAAHAASICSLHA